MALPLALPDDAVAAGRFPYAAVVNEDGGEFRSGPGESYYATSKAEQGQAVEVYHDDGDWSAVRPPRESHSWVAAKLLDLPATLRVQDNADLTSPVAVEVAVDNAPAFIGSQVAADRDAVAVRLKTGERVWVLSAEEAAGQTWIKIAPPSGEFRWIETRLLRATASGPETSERTAADARDSAASDDEAAKTEPGDKITAERVTADDGADADDGVATLAAAEDAAESADGQGAQSTVAAEGESSVLRREDAKPTAARANPARGFWTQLQALELELSMKVAGQPGQWNFAAIRRDAQNLYDGAKSDEEYDAARYLLAKLAQFESVRRERVDLEERIARRESAGGTAAGDVKDKSNGGGADAARSRASLAGPPPRASGNENGAAEAGKSAAPPAAGIADDRYDAAGRLVSIPTSKQGAPSYAIVDERNIVRQYVSPAPRVNLQPYVGRTVGITGVAGPSPDAVRPHVMAKRIDVLDVPVRR